MKSQSTRNNWPFGTMVSASATMICLILTTCGVELHTIPDDRLQLGNEGCELGHVILGEKLESGEVRPTRCVQFAPRVAGPECVDIWKPQSHSQVVDELNFGSRDTRITKARAITPNGLKSNVNGRLKLIKFGGSLDVQTTAIKIDGKTEYVRIALDITSGRTVLTVDQNTCMKAQPLSYVATTVGALPREVVMGYVSQIDLGYLQFLDLVNAKVGASVAGKVVIEADDFDLSVHTRGKMLDSFRPILKKMLDELDGKDAALNGVDATTAADEIQLYASLFVTATPFPILTAPPQTTQQ